MRSAVFNLGRKSPESCTGLFLNLNTDKHMNNNKEKTQQNYIIPFAKPTSVTSFKSMHTVKKILGTKKVGHTGTLDLFADGLLVLLSDQYTRFAELISAGTKEYRAWLEFGKQTDTLDPEGELCLEKPLPSFAEFEKAVESFLGKQEQIPPKFSAIKIKGKRASDRIRAGEKLEMKTRPIEIFELEILQVITEKDERLVENAEGLANKNNAETIKGIENKSNSENNTKTNTAKKIHFAELRIRCSKGTYIRSLARDIAEKTGSCAYLRALRRTAVGHFKLEDAVGYSQLSDFSKLAETFTAETFTNDESEKTAEFEEGVENKSNDSRGGTAKKNSYITDGLSEELFEKAKRFTAELAKSLNIETCELHQKYLFAFQHGKPIKKHWFCFANDTSELEENKAIAVFCEDICVGLITKTDNKLKYQLVFN